MIGIAVADDRNRDRSPLVLTADLGTASKSKIEPTNYRSFVMVSSQNLSTAKLTNEHEDLWSEVYPELRRLAGKALRNERATHTLQATALVHEAFLRLKKPIPQDRSAILSRSATAIRRVLVDHARRRQAQKRDRGGFRCLFGDDALGSFSPDYSFVLAIDEALEELEAFDPRMKQLIELRFFGGLQNEEAAEVLGVSLATLKRDWHLAKGWLQQRILSE